MNLSPVDGFVIRLKVATYGGIVLALPVWLYELWRFITPALDPSEKRYAIPFVASAIVLFAIGAFVAFLTLEPALKFLIQVGGPAQQAAVHVRQVPVADRADDRRLRASASSSRSCSCSCSSRDIITTVQLRHARRWAAVGIVTFAAVITPSQDPYSLFFMAVPMYLFYEASIIIGRILKR